MSQQKVLPAKAGMQAGIVARPISDPVGARMARLSQRLDATGSAWGEAHALADGFLYGCHGSIMHQHAP